MPNSHLSRLYLLTYYFVDVKQMLWHIVCIHQVTCDITWCPLVVVSSWRERLVVVKSQQCSSSCPPCCTLSLESAFFCDKSCGQRLVNALQVQHHHKLTHQSAWGTVYHKPQLARQTKLSFSGWYVPNTHDLSVFLHIETRFCISRVFG